MISEMSRMHTAVSSNCLWWFVSGMCKRRLNRLQSCAFHIGCVRVHCATKPITIQRMRDNANTIPISNQLSGWLAIKFGIDLDDIFVWRRYVSPIHGKMCWKSMNIQRINAESKHNKWQRNDVIYLTFRVNVSSVRIGDNSLSLSLPVCVSLFTFSSIGSQSVLSRFSVSIVSILS